jgi:hypothetical protein
MIKVFNKATNEFLGRISETDLQFLADHLEEEGLADRDYFIRAETIETFPAEGASPHLVEVLKGGLRSEQSVEIRWEEDSKRL